MDPRTSEPPAKAIPIAEMQPALKARLEYMADQYREDDAGMRAQMRVWRIEHFAHYRQGDDPLSAKHARRAYWHLTALRLAELPPRSPLWAGR